ncbi:MAG: TRAP transporter small permease [Burkholderiales bacterium]|nr:TRAP transporter small permease [Burkholderiales bacterium]ODU63020.1 MAG: C4-dicarboxylate ABC transporter [Lautropia sp. SCN 66-9]
MSDPAQTPPLEDHTEPIIAPPAHRTAEDWIGAIAMGLLAVITFANVLARYFTSESFAWTEEISISLMVILTMVAASAAVVRDRHIRIEFLFNSGSPQRRRRLAHLSDALTALAFLLMFGLGLRLFWDDYRFEVTSPGIGVPQWWYTIWLPILALLIAARALQNIIRRRRAS